MRDAYEFVKSKRIVCPNLGFLLVLAEYEKSTWSRRVHRRPQRSRTHSTPEQPRPNNRGPPTRFAAMAAVHGSPLGSSIENLHELSLSQLSVLLVHGPGENADTIKETVGRLGHECDLVTDGSAVVARIHQRQYDLIIMDAHPPGVSSGLQLVQQIRAIDSDVRISPALLLADAPLSPTHRRRRVAGSRDRVVVQTVPAGMAIILLSSDDDIQGAHSARTPLSANSAAAAAATAGIAQLTAQATATGPNPATASTASTAHTSGTAPLPAGVDDMIHKPLTSENLAAALTRQLSLRRLGAT